ncbi:MAG: hypothetical protein VKJ64_13160 [Leptolyngbyaceae bacterium]|nr:hypothetical protein [Leptolyngbyaceae bacterium]
MNNLELATPPVEESVQYISNQQGNITGVIVPIDVWQDLISELETQHLLKSKTMRQRLLEAGNREGGISLNQAIEQLDLPEIHEAT